MFSVSLLYEGGGECVVGVFMHFSLSFFLAEIRAYGELRKISSDYCSF